MVNFHCFPSNALSSQPHPQGPTVSYDQKLVKKKRCSGLGCISTAPPVALVLCAVNISRKEWQLY